MPRDGAIIFSDLIGKLNVLRIECANCGRSGRYRLAVLIAKYGRDAKLFDQSNELTADSPRKRAAEVAGLLQGDLVKRPEPDNPILTAALIPKEPIASTGGTDPED